MVHAMQVLPADHISPNGGGCPQVQVHYDYRDVFGTGIAVRVYGEMKIAAGERVIAKELGLKTSDSRFMKADWKAGYSFAIESHSHMT